MSALSELSTLRKQKGGANSPTEKADGRWSLFFLGPWYIGLILITAGPLLASLYLSFTDYDLLTDPQFIGVENYTQMFSDPRLIKSLQVTAIYVFVSVPLQLAAALGLALLLDRGMRGLALYRSAFYLPSLLGGSVAIAILWRQIFGTTGLINQVLSIFGIEGQGWVSHPDYALSTLIVLNVWTFGAPMIIFLAGLRQIPEMYYEAASIDGATRLRQFWSITIPMLTPIIFFNLVLQLIGAMQTFTQAFVVSGGSGGPADSTLFFTLYLYQQGFASLNMGYASAMAWLLLILTAVLTALNFLLSKYWVFYND
ncbi:carbohydrate ABC transporter permease [Cellulomonas aerilata]|uniref:ABC transporter permease n=1 Tax=Cellulomonas aerilata TaxID=515326 RepID=A0A512DCS9_9CELL|nr:sugar ABC transporter permease [Cellulomonas aerilata]GEO34237.1 ABC transporter permease [Cellulomonas aerilata]